MPHAPSGRLADPDRLGQVHRRNPLVGLQDEPQAGLSGAGALSVKARGNELAFWYA